MAKTNQKYMNQIRRKKLSYEIEITNKKRTNFHLLGRREKKREKNQSVTSHHTVNNKHCTKLPSM
jgi:hypothetical protein